MIWSARILRFLWNLELALDRKGGIVLQAGDEEDCPGSASKPGIVGIAAIYGHDGPKG